MNSLIEILIDASGSMGREVVNGEQFLLPDGSSRTDLVKKILRNNLKMIIQDSEQLVIEVFRSKNLLDATGKPLIENKQYVQNKKDVSEMIYDIGIFQESKFEETLNNLQDPPRQGTPLYRVLLNSMRCVYDNHQIIVFTDGDATDQVNFDVEIIKYIEVFKNRTAIHFIGVNQNAAAQEKCKNIAVASNGSYVNIEAINYDEQALNKFLFPIKSKITQQQIKTAVQQTIVNSVPVAETIAKAERIVAKEPEKTTSKDDQVSKEILNKFVPSNELTHQVERNSRALSQISIQLENIVGLLQGNDFEDSITIEENPIHNQRVGRKAEEILFNKLKTLNWEKVEWLNEKEESYNSYDFYIENKEHKAFYECKGTAAGLNSFYLTASEWSFYLSNRGNYRLCFIQHVDGEPVIYRFMDLLDDLEKGKLKLHHSRNHNVKANSITFFVDVENVTIF